jgi:parvulin-like peptidyl-prolyl isomerase
MQAIGPAVALIIFGLTTVGLAETSRDAEKTAAVKDSSPAANRTLVEVNGQAITEGDLSFLMISRRVPADLRPTVQTRFIEQIIDRRLMRAYLAGRKDKPDPMELDAQVARIEKLIRRSGDDPQQVLTRLGYTEKTLREELALPLSWRMHAIRVITSNQLREYFRKHRQKLDGTQVRASQIFLKHSPEDAAARKEAALEMLQNIRAEIVGGKSSFADAARKHSQAPSGQQGGDVGFFEYRGKMPEAFTRVVFPLKIGEVSQPFVTPFGVHLATVTALKVGDLSLEDVRGGVFKKLSQQLWNEIVQQQRAKAKIEWKVEAKSL